MQSVSIKIIINTLHELKIQLKYIKQKTNNENYINNFINNFTCKLF